MKTTVDIPDDLFRQAKAQAALRGVPLKTLIVRGLQLALKDKGMEPQSRRVSFPLIRSAGPMITNEDVARALLTLEMEDFDSPYLPD